MKTETLQIIAIVEGVALAVCIGLLLLACRRIRIKNCALRNSIRREYEQIMWRANPQNLKQRKPYAIPVDKGTVSKTDLVKEVAALSPLSIGKVSRVIECIIEVDMIEGKKINLNNNLFHKGT